ncbi:hypothetical protein ElyMa_000252100 [Elysia marginata]|uniref:Uncharacterized protein n=1 Tax=Elysia marginata TaxID=1093978 RepID=A0AAV4F3R3_9GAST|nr:hypothetical protein ElyMa_000252100 [Elysia marginata]
MESNCSPRTHLTFIFRFVKVDNETTKAQVLWMHTASRNMSKKHIPQGRECARDKGRPPAELRQTGKTKITVKFIFSRVSDDLAQWLDHQNDHVTATVVQNLELYSLPSA